MIADFASRNEALCELLQRFDLCSRQIRREARLVSFDDLVLTLVEGWQNHRLGQLAYRLDTQFEHLLLDEFQDTSLSQWLALESLARHVASEPGSSFFCVGDAKQAIYGWRGGNAKLFLAIPEQLSIDAEPLSVSFRSSPIIMEAVNLICQRLDYHPDLDDPATQAITDWKARVDEHRADQTELPGYVALRTAPAAPPSVKQFATTMQYAIGLIRELTLQSPSASIGVLVRRNETVQQLVNGLRAIDLPASHEGKGQLTDSVAVQAVLSLLKLADHPGDTIARYHVACSPVGRLFQFENDRDDELAARWLGAYAVNCCSKVTASSCIDWPAISIATAVCIPAAACGSLSTRPSHTNRARRCARQTL